jgi:hypothetical protein
LLGCYGCFEAHHPDDLFTLPPKLLLQHTAICIQVEEWLPENISLLFPSWLASKNIDDLEAIWYWRRLGLFQRRDEAF